jgi:hypothetical protein
MMGNTPDIRVTSCAGCQRTVTVTGRGEALGDFEWFCPYQDSACPRHNVGQTVRQIRGPLEAVLAGMPRRPGGEPLDRN